MNIRKITVLSAALVLLTACGSSAGTSDTQETAPSDTSAVSESAVPSETSDTAESSELSETTSAEPETVPAEPMEYTISSLKGPTTMGMVKLMSDSEKGETFNKYNVTIYGTADEIVTGIVSGTTDIANVPANLAAVLYNKTDGNIKTAAVNTLGVLYVVTSGEEITSVADLKGKTVYSTGKGTTPEYVLNYILRANGLEPQTDVTIEYRSEA
ncbi:MAG: PhnD/SsuA/transferrin family substrate-binding protein, partial [Huintestinicola sp.]